MLDESLLAPRPTLSNTDEERLVFLVQATFIEGGSLLTFTGQHGAMDMTGQSQVIRLLAKACRREPFTLDELSVGNMDRGGG
ncbi:hypothetical protein ASPZODRAFT_135268 [Penicilliopsis zonata CBS 506.65]|uniref:Trichothecene 3-O-acetyltransferase-like N-terminal domain-containing protein n=1 Tax=Penicilliopsis zonata CBS 506.65 TaxID=1073090 RepID=A0A1L9SBA2_9EURO|nr:hypothetical protein ASPZODRAFT_135268 [Penicilliopsis zonata CBS 506.65]OJJ44444.1 hypothetical protein ASPZODRAFT_135268 [Penicilliopsis zonata CBS 506.65]